VAVTPEQLAHNGTEDNHQAALFCWAALPAQQFKYPELRLMLFAIPNGGERHIAVAAKLKATGTKAGVSDIFLSVARGGYHGLYIELKDMTGRAKDNQLAFIAAAQSEGYAACVCHGWIAAAKAIQQYMDQPR